MKAFNLDNEVVSLARIDCGSCGGVYAITESHRAEKARLGGYWSCPYCKCSWGFGDSETAQLKRALESERKRTEWAQQEARLQRENAAQWQRKEQAQRAAKTRIKNRVGKGVCPCCNRTFANLQRHMSGQHPEWSAE